MLVFHIPVLSNMYTRAMTAYINCRYPRISCTTYYMQSRFVYAINFVTGKFGD